MSDKNEEDAYGKINCIMVITHLNVFLYLPVLGALPHAKYGYFIFKRKEKCIMYGNTYYFAKLQNGELKKMVSMFESEDRYYVSTDICIGSTKFKHVQYLYEFAVFGDSAMGKLPLPSDYQSFLNNNCVPKICEILKRNGINEKVIAFYELSVCYESGECIKAIKRITAQEIVRDADEDFDIAQKLLGTEVIHKVDCSIEPWLPTNP